MVDLSPSPFAPSLPVNTNLTPTPSPRARSEHLPVTAQYEVWGKLVGVVVLGGDIIYTFGHARVVMGRPDGSRAN